MPKYVKGQSGYLHSKGRPLGPQPSQVLKDMRRVYRGRAEGRGWTSAQEELKGWLKKKPLQFMETMMGLEKQFRQEVMNWRHAEHMKEVEGKKKEPAKEEAGEKSGVTEADAAEERCEEVTERLLRGWADVKQRELAQAGAAGGAGERDLPALAQARGAGVESSAGGSTEEVPG